MFTFFKKIKLSTKSGEPDTLEKKSKPLKETKIKNPPFFSIEEMSNIFIESLLGSKGNHPSSVESSFVKDIVDSTKKAQEVSSVTPSSKREVEIVTLRKEDFIAIEKKVRDLEEKLRELEKKK